MFMEFAGIVRKKLGMGVDLFLEFGYFCTLEFKRILWVRELYYLVI